MTGWMLPRGPVLIREDKNLIYPYRRNKGFQQVRSAHCPCWKSSGLPYSEMDQTGWKPVAMFGLYNG